MQRKNKFGDYREQLEVLKQLGATDEQRPTRKVNFDELGLDIPIDVPENEF